jgi:Tfp pilus assembly protein PilF
MPGHGDRDEAVRWARKAIEFEPGNPDYSNTLGVALYRAGRFAEAAEELGRNASKEHPFAGYDWVFLSMCRQRLGQADAARSALTRALDWQAKAIGLGPDQTAEFQTILLEARAVLDGSLPDFPPEVFDR